MRSVEIGLPGTFRPSLLNSVDWAATPVGPEPGWPQSLRTAVSICLESRFPMIIFWGADLVQFYNEAYIPILGAKHPRALGQRAIDCWPEIWQQIGPMLRGVLATGTATWSDDMLLRLERKGFVEDCYFTFSYSPITDENGIGGVFCAVTETTAKVLREREAVERAHALAELNRAKTDFFNNVSHEFRTPLTLILGPLDDALRAGRPLALDEADAMRRNARRLLRLVNELLEFSRIDANRLAPQLHAVDVSLLTRDLASTFRSLVESAGLAFDVDVEPIAPVAIDARLWEHVVLNLLSNAFKFTFQGRIAVSLRRVDERIRLEVTDDGVGMKPQDAARAFERFWRGPAARARTHEGSGIGLALVAEIAALHGGEARLDSVDGRGTRVTVEIPFVPASGAAADAGAGEAELVLAQVSGWGQSSAPATHAAASPGAGAAAPNRPRLLLVEDNADLRGYVTRLLSAAYEVVTAGDGEAGLAAALASPPDIILSDVMMPGLDGLEFVRRMRAHRATRETPIVLMSARAGERAAESGLRAGADDYVAKPFSSEDLLSRLDRQLTRARIRAEESARFRRLADEIPVVIWTEDAANEPEWINKRWFDVTGLTRDAFPDDLRLRRVVHPIDLARFLAMRDAFQTQAHAFETEVRIKALDAPDAAFRWHITRVVPIHDNDGTLVRWVGTATDIHENRRLAEQRELDLKELAESEVKYRRLIETTNEGIWVVDAEFRTILVNKPTADMLGYTIEEFAGRSSWEFVDDEQRHFAEAAVRGVIENGHWQGELPLRKRDGSAIWVFLSSAKVTSDDGALEGFIVFMHDVTERKRSELARELVVEATSALAESLGLDQTLDNLLAVVVPRLADWASIALSPEQGVTESVSSTPRAAPTRTKRIAHAGVSVPSARPDSTVTVPLAVRGQSIGTMTLGSHRRRYDDGDAALFGELAARAAIAIEHARLYDRERRIALTLQAAALPKSLPTIPGISFDAVYQAARSEALVGGDWYDAFRLDDGRIVLSIGDVMGSGLDAAVTMSAARQAIRGATQIYPDPVAVLDAADRALRSDQPDRIVTAFVGMLDPLTLSFTYASAGHPPPLVRSADGSIAELGGSGLPLGLRDPSRFRERSHSVALSDQALLVLYTDGLVESSRDLLEGDRRLRDALNDSAVLSAEHPASAIRDAVIDLAQDDIALLTVHIDNVRSRVTQLAGTGPEQARWTFDAHDPDAARSVRHAIADALRRHGATEPDIYDAEMIFSELVGNVVRHSGGQVELAVDITGKAPVLHVMDRGSGFTFHARLPNDVMSESGRGLYIAATLASELSVLPRREGGSHARAVLAFATRRAPQLGESA